MSINLAGGHPITPLDGHAVTLSGVALVLSHAALVQFFTCYCNTYRRRFGKYSWAGEYDRAEAMDLGLANAAAAVVGGSSGMGLATARCFAEEGARVAVIGRTEATLAGAVADLTDRGSPDVLGLVADIGDAAQVDRAFAELGARWEGELNVLINTVG